MIIFCYGRRYVGKTTLAVYLARRAPTRIKFDPRGMINVAGAATFPDAAELFDALDTKSEIVIQPEYHVDRTFESTCETLVHWLRENPGEQVTFLIDEARMIDSKSAISPSFDWLLRFTDKNNVTIIFTAHRPGDIAVDIRAIGDYWCLFKTTQEHDLKVISERCGPEVASLVSQLGEREFIVWNDGTSRFHKVTDQSSWYRPLSERKEVAA